MDRDSKRKQNKREDFTTELLDSFNSLKRFESEEADQKKWRKIKLLSVVLVAYTILAIYLLTGGVSSVVLSNFGKVNDEKYSSIEFTKFENRLTDLEKQIATYQSTTTDANISSLIIKVDNLSTRQDVIDASILENPDKALTAALLREKQNNLEQIFNDLKGRQLNLEGKLDTIIIAPLFLTLLGFLAWLLQRLWVGREKKTVRNF